METKNVFTELFSLNVNEHVEKKQTGKTPLSYLSWPWAVAEVKKRYPDMSYKIKTFENGLPYVYDRNTGYMVFTEVTIEGITHEMWLPVMDGRNDAMLDHPVQHVKVDNYGKEKKWTTEAATMFDINKTIMRCLVKNLAMFGLGLYIYSGEDLPEEDTSTVVQTTPKKYSKAPQQQELVQVSFKKSAQAPAPTPSPAADSPELKEAIQTVNYYIEKDMLNKSWIPTANQYIATKDLEGLKRVITFMEKQIKETVEKELEETA